jgi:DNA-binding NarL/FixJ family response regulator
MGNQTVRLIVVDDQVLFREGLVGLFRSQKDFQIVGEAGSVQEAIELSRLVQPELILMDYLLPDGSGVDATLTILKENPWVKIVFLTSYESDENFFLAMRSGAYGYLLKNMPSAKLLAALRALEQGEAAISRRMVTRLLEEFIHIDFQKEDRRLKLRQLSKRELEILREIAGGCTNREIAERLVLSESTVKNHVHQVLRKLGLQSRQEVAYKIDQYSLA